MKEKRIEQLEQGMDDRKAEAELRRAEMISIQKKIRLGKRRNKKCRIKKRRFKRTKQNINISIGSKRNRRCQPNRAAERIECQFRASQKNVETKRP